MTSIDGPARLLVVACGALAREFSDLIEFNGLAEVRLECLPAHLHNRPERIAPLLDRRLREARGSFDSVLVGYGDCGSSGAIDEVCARHGAARLPGAHCYEFLAGSATFAAIHDPDPTSFYLTDYLARHFDRLVLDGLGITEHPELRDAYFGNYTRIVLLTQRTDPEIEAFAQRAAASLDLALEIHDTGYGDMEPHLLRAAGVHVDLQPATDVAGASR